MVKLFRLTSSDFQWLGEELNSSREGILLGKTEKANWERKLVRKVFILFKRSFYKLENEKQEEEPSYLQKKYRLPTFNYKFSGCRKMSSN